MRNSTCLFFSWVTRLRVAVLKAALFAVGVIGGGAVQSNAAPLILAQPTNSSFYLGGTNAVNFKVLAKGSSNTYQWYVTGTGGGSSPVVTGGSASILSITGIADKTLDHTQYNCVVSNVSGSTSSAFAALRVYSTPSLTPSVTLSSGTIPANSGSNININITGLSSGNTVRIQRILDLNGDGAFDIGEPLVDDFLVTDGTSSVIGGVPNPGVPGDDDGTANGAIVTHLSLPTSCETGRTAGNYLIRVMSPSGEFAPVQTSLTVAQPDYGQSVSGKVVLTTGSAVANAVVIMLASSGNQHNYIASTVADASGDYTLSAPVGSYGLIAAHIGGVASTSSAVSIALSSGTTLVSQNPILTTASCTIAGQVQDVSGTATVLRGVQVNFQSTGNYFSLTTSDANGNYIAGAVPDEWQGSSSDYSLTRLGFIALQSETSVGTTSGNVTALNLQYNRATALISGTVRDGTGTPRSGIVVNAYLGNASIAPTSDSNGAFTMAVTPGTWSVGVAHDYADANNLVSMSDLSETMINGQAISNLSIRFATATGTMSGTVLNSGSAVADSSVYANASVNGVSYNASASTDGSGNYSFPILSGTWNVGVQSPFLFDSQNVIVTGSSTTVNFNSVPVVAHLTGTVTNNGSPVSGASIGAQLGGSGTNPTLFTITGTDGRFDLGVTASGTWTMNMEYNYARTNNWVAPSLPEIVTNNLSVFNINYPILNGTELISGTVLGSGSTPFTYTNVAASASINGLNYFAQAYTDSNGGYSFPVISGTWTIGVNGSSYFIPQTVIVGGSSIQVNFLPPTPYQLWRQVHFNQTQIGQSNVSGLSALVSSGAGFTNLLAYSLGLEPSLAKSSDLPGLAQPQLSGTNYPTLQFTRNTAASDVTYTVQTCSDLTGWSTLSTFSHGTWTPSNMVTETYNSSSVNNVKIQDTVSYKSATKHFMRLNVTY